MDLFTVLIVGSFSEIVDNLDVFKEMMDEEIKTTPHHYQQIH